MNLILGVKVVEFKSFPVAISRGRRGESIWGGRTSYSWCFSISNSLPVEADDANVVHGRSPCPLTAHRVRVLLAHRDAVGRGASTPSLTVVRSLE